MKLTFEQRLREVERDNAVLHGTIEMLHKLLKEQGKLISEYITLKMGAAEDNGNGRPEEQLYTFVCRRRFDQVEKDIKRVLESIENLMVG